MTGTSKHILVSTLLICLTLAAVKIHAGDVTLQVGITGSNNLQGLLDPVSVAKMPDVSRLLQAIADQPRSAEYITQSLDGSKANLSLLLELGLLKIWDGQYAINFNYLTLEDHELLITVIEPFAESLAQSFRDRWSEFEAMFGAYDQDHVDTGEVAYSIIGAMSLDWDGLDITAGKDLRITADQLPEGREFIIWAKEQSSEINTRGLYWGSHNTVVNGTRFTTFGDHYTLPRLGLPDLLWSTSNRVAKLEGVPRSLRASVSNALAPYYQDDFLKDVGTILRLLRQGPAKSHFISEKTGIDEDRIESTLAFLEELQYVCKHEASYVLKRPYFSMADKPMIDAVRALGLQLMDNWLDLNSSAVKDSLAKLSAIQYDVPYRQLFTQIWHYLFGMANQALVESAHFADPYADERLSKGMIPFAFDADLLDIQTEARN